MIAIAASMMMVLGLGTAMADDPITLRLSNNQPDGNVTTQACEWFAEQVKERTNGRIEIQVYNNGTLGDAVSCLEQALLPEMDLETIEYQAEDASIHLKLSTSKPEQVSLFCEKIEENSGFSLQQSHWQQQEDKVSAALVFTIGKGAKDEAQ